MPNLDPVEALKMSYYTGPNERSFRALRIALATQGDALSDPELAVAAAAIYALRNRLNGSLIAHAERHIPRERVAQLLNALPVLT